MSTLVTDGISAPARVGHAIRAALGHKRNRRVVAAAGVGVGQRMVQLASTLVLMPLLLRVLGPAKFGVWGAAASLAWLSSLVDIGTGTALVTLVARSSALDRAEQARRHIAGALSIGSGLATLLLLAACVVASITGKAQGSAGAYFIAAIGLAINLPLNASNNVWMALQKGYVSSFWELIQTLLTTAGLIGATMLTRDVRVYVAVVYAGLVLANIGSLIHLFLRHPELRPEALWVSWPAMKEVGGQGVLYFTLALAGGLTFVLDNVLALGLLGPEASARMTIALRICIAAVGGLAVISQPLWPAFAEAAERADKKWIRRILCSLARPCWLGITIGGLVLLVVYGERLLRGWLHTDLGIGTRLLWAISAWVLAQAVLAIPSLLTERSVDTSLSDRGGLSRHRTRVCFEICVRTLSWGCRNSLGHNYVLLLATPAYIWRIWRWAAQPSRVRAR